MGTLYQLVDGWTKQPWDGENYLRITEEIFGYLNVRGEGVSNLGGAVNLLRRSISENNETIEMGLDTDETARESLKRMMQREDFKEYAQKMEVDVQTEPELKAVVTNLEDLI